MANEYLNNRTFESIIQAFQYYKRQRAKYELIVADFKETYERRVAKYGDEAHKARYDEALARQKEAIGNYKDYQDQLALAFYILSENIANYAKFSGIDIDDAIQEGVLICFEKIDRFDPRKGKAFNYMTTCILNHFRQLYRSARNYNELKRKYHGFLEEKLGSLLIKNSNNRNNYRGVQRHDQ